MLKLKTSYIRMDSAALLLLFTLYTVSAVSVVLTVCKQYQYAVKASDIHYENRNVAGYLREKLHQNNVADTIVITDIGDTKGLMIKNTVAGSTYETYIYDKEGWLYELVGKEGGTYLLEAGQPVIEAADIKWHCITPNLLEVSYTDTDGRKQSVYFNVLSVRENG